jgi:hypothetical protein
LHGVLQVIDGLGCIRQDGFERLAIVRWLEFLQFGGPERGVDIPAQKLAECLIFEQVSAECLQKPSL